MFSLDTKEIGNWLTIGADVKAPTSAEFSWMNERGIFYSTTMELKPNATGLFNVDLANGKYWNGPVHQFKLRLLPDSETNQRCNVPFGCDPSPPAGSGEYRRHVLLASKTRSSAPDTKPRSSSTWSTAAARTLQR